MLEKKRSYKGFHVALFVPEVIEPGKPGGRVQISTRNEDMGIRFTPDWPPARNAAGGRGLAFCLRRRDHRL